MSHSRIIALLQSSHFPNEQTAREGGKVKTLTHFARIRARIQASRLQFQCSLSCNALPQRLLDPSAWLLGSWARRNHSNPALPGLVPKCHAACGGRERGGQWVWCNRTSSEGLLQPLWQSWQPGTSHCPTGLLGAPPGPPPLPHSCFPTQAACNLSASLSPTAPPQLCCFPVMRKRRREDYASVSLE